VKKITVVFEKIGKNPLTSTHSEFLKNDVTEKTKAKLINTKGQFQQPFANTIVQKVIKLATDC